MQATAERVTPADSKLETSLFKMVFLKTRHEIAERGTPTYYKGPETEITFSNKELIVNVPFSVVPWLVGFKQWKGILREMEKGKRQGQLSA